MGHVVRRLNDTHHICIYTLPALFSAGQAGYQSSIRFYPDVSTSLASTKYMYLCSSDQMILKYNTYSILLQYTLSYGNAQFRHLEVVRFKEDVNVKKILRNVVKTTSNTKEESVIVLNKETLKSTGDAFYGDSVNKRINIDT